ncbi:A24 family peptidase (plasmid) [Aneurinibacillus sp. Ricciae_BoGa-3]|uniref:prepilin peptidase n=1 Tax=Aneurinibacillus sp. Ricciae_BoGa-3 TaxID=3022697 RepID=UPI002341A5F7|nr:A24 family peptidase [Aneurinibacillus sp. Ricciae_BoGa-3]WCK57671.1 A24 family peptidase [Aneurinibacillus sp. Ricciae_BoGa-3]
MDYLYVIVVAILAQFLLNVVSTKIKYPYSLVYKITAIIVNATAWSFTYHKFGLTPTFAVLAVAETFLIASSFIDLTYKEIPNSYNLIVALLGGGFIFIYKDFYQQLLLGGIIAFVLFLVIMMLTGAMGGGDVKMAGAVGLFMGTGLIMKFIVYSFFSGAIIAILLLLFKKKRKSDFFPFGPCIALSSIYLFIFLV